MAGVYWFMLGLYTLFGEGLRVAYWYTDSAGFI